MADDDKGSNPVTPSPVEHPANTGVVKPSAVMDPQTEWTASDRRGPLGSAGDEDIERFVPAHETDAEGGADLGARDPIAHEPAGHEKFEHEASSADGGAPHGEATLDDKAVSPALASHDDARATPLPGGPDAGPEHKRSLLPVAAGLVFGALVGAGSAWLVYAQSSDGSGNRQQLAALSSRIDALDKRPDPQPELTRLQSDLADLKGKVTALDTRAPAAASAPGQAAATVRDEPAKAPEPATPGQTNPAVATQPADADLAGKVAALQEALDKVTSRTNALQAQDAKEDGAGAKVAALQTGVADAQKQAAGAQSALDALKSEQTQLGEKIAGLTVAVAGALKKADGALTNAATVQSQQKVLEGKLGSPALAVVADSLRQQVDAGQPYTRQVDALATLGADQAKIAVLRENAARGVPSAQTLLAQWKPLVDPVIATGNKAPASANFGQRLEHGLFGLVSVRRADGTAGNDLGSRVDLITADLAHGDVAGAFAAWQALPPDARAKSDSWGALAKTSVEALTAASDLQHSAIDALGAKKS